MKEITLKIKFKDDAAECDVVHDVTMAMCKINEFALPACGNCCDENDDHACDSCIDECKYVEIVDSKITLINELIDIIAKEQIIISLQYNKERSIIVTVSSFDGLHTDFRCDTTESFVQLLKHEIEVLRIMQRNRRNIACNNG